MRDLFESGDFTLLSVVKTGKKEVGGELEFKSFPSPIGDCRKILALQSGVVIFAGRAKTGERACRYKLHVIVRSEDGIEITYGNVTARHCKAGDIVRAGDVIAEEENGMVKLEVRRNGRKIDACAWLGVRTDARGWQRPSSRYESEVCEACGIPEDLRGIIDGRKDSLTIWRSIWKAIQDGGRNPG